MGVTSSFVEVTDDARFVEYAGGYASQLRTRLHNREGITARELQWLFVNTGLQDPEEACAVLIKKYVIHRTTQRLFK